MRYLYYCNSAYQLLNAIDLHTNRLFNNFENIENYEGEILLIDVFDGAKDIANILSENKIFSKVFVGNRVYKKDKFHIIENIFDIINPSNFIYKANGIKKEDLYDRYDYIVTPKFATIIAAVWSMNKRAKLQLYEDGLGAYHTTQLEPNSNTYKLLYKTFNHGRTFNDYECLYLNCPSLYVGKETKIKGMPKLDKKYLDNLAKMFKDFDFGLSKKIIWFDQYIVDDLNDVSRKLLSEYKDDVIYCTHPRHPKNYEEFSKPNSKHLWELACLGIKDINNNCLSTIHSTAVFTPKLLYGFEPYIIFTAKLLSGYKNNDKDILEKVEIINKFKSMYSDKSKIMIPETIEEYRKCVDNFINNK